MEIITSHLASVLLPSNGMDPTLYRAAMEGHVDVLRQHKDQLGVQLTANKSTVLHVAAQFHDNIECVKVILNLQPTLLCQVNSKLETAFYIAARNGHSNTVRELIEYSKSLEGLKSLQTMCLFLFPPVWESLHSYFSIRRGRGVQIIKEMMIWMTNKHKDTALHEAVRNNHHDVVKMLLREDAVFPHVVNNFEETPLYIAAKKDYHDILSTILEVCISPAYRGPNLRTALHAAVIAGCPICTQKILEKKPKLVKEADLDGWTPLHHAAYLNIVPCAIQLLKADKSTVYYKNDNDQTALHIAASRGHTDIMRELLSHRPDCWEIVNGEGHNILHIAMEQEKEEVINFIRSPDVKNSWLSNLENQMDNEGNTPFNLRPVSSKGSTPIVKGNKPTDQDEIKEELENVDIARHQLNRRTHETGMKKPKAEDAEIGLEDFNDIRNSHLVVAALIATVTFTAGLTLPGGFHSNDGPDQGTALLVRVAAFKAFVITNALAMMLSFSAILVHLISPLTKVLRELEKQFTFGVFLIQYAMIAMLIAFMSGSYAVLANSSDLAVGVLIAGSSFVLMNLVRNAIGLQGATKTWTEWLSGRKRTARKGRN